MRERALPTPRWRRILPLLCAAAVLGVAASPAAASNWSSPATLWSADNAYPFTDPSVAMSPNHHAAVVWDGTTEADGDQVLGSTLLSNGTWTSPLVLSGDEAAYRPSPHVGMDANGDATAVWVTNSAQPAGAGPRGSEYGIMASTRGPGDGDAWSTPHQIVGPYGGSEPENLVLAVGPDGTAVVMFQDGPNVYALTRPGQDGTWSGVALLGSGTIDAQEPDGSGAAVDAAGDVLVSWTDWRQPRTADGRVCSVGNYVLAASWPAGASQFSEPETVFEGCTDKQAMGTDVAFDGAGNARLVFYQTDYDDTSNPQAFASYRSVNDGSWSTPVQLGVDDDQAVGPQVSMDSAGHAVSLWQAFGDGSIKSALAGGGGDFGTPFDAAGAGTTPTDSSYWYFPWLSMDAGGNAFGMWNPSSGGLQAAILPSGGSGFGAADPITADPIDRDLVSHHLGAALAGGGANEAVAAWATTPQNTSAGAREVEPRVDVKVSLYRLPSAQQQSQQQQASTTPPVTIKAPSVTSCLSKRYFHIHVWKPRGARIVRAQVIQRGHRVRSVRITFRHGWVNLRNLPKGTFTVRVWARYRGRTFHSITRTYHTCYPGRLPGQFG